MPVESTEPELFQIGTAKVLEFAINEAAQAGIDNMVLVCAPEVLEEVRGFCDTLPDSARIQCIEHAPGGLGRALDAARNCLIPEEDAFLVISPRDVILTANENAQNASQQMIDGYQKGDIRLGAVKVGAETVYAGRAILPSSIMRSLQLAVMRDEGDVTLADVIRDQPNTSKVLEGMHFNCRDREQVAPMQTFYNLANSGLGPAIATRIVHRAFPDLVDPTQGLERPLSGVIAEVDGAVPQEPCGF